MNELILNGVKLEETENKTEPEMFAKIGLAIGEYFGSTSTVVIGCESETASQTAVSAVTSGLLYYGINIKVVEETVLPVLRWMCRQGVCDGGIYISGKQTENICIFPETQGIFT